MKIAAERDKDTLGILRKLNINTPSPLAAGRDNYLIVVGDALDAATTLEIDTHPDE